MKRLLDATAAAAGLLVLAPVIGLAVLASRRSTGLSGLFRQQRVGRGGQAFEVLKVRTMRDVPGVTTCVTADGDPRITRLGHWLRKTKIDELPQLWNVLRGEMSLVGPRPDVPRQLALLTPADRAALLDMRPGVTGPASLKYRREEELLAASGDPQRLNDEVFWPDKVRINLEYARNWSLLGDLRLIAATALSHGMAPLPPAAVPFTADCPAADRDQVDRHTAAPRKAA